MILNFLSTHIKNNQSIQNNFKELSGKSFKINISGIAFNALINSDGTLIKHSNTPDATIIIPSTVITQLSGSKTSIFKELTVIGDANLAQKVLINLASIKFTHDYHDNAISKIILVKPFLTLFNTFKSHLELIHNNIFTHTHDYLLYESNLLVTQYEIDGFCNQVDELNSKIDRLNKYIGSQNANIPTP